jgi:molybdate transport system substrate-binding protein
MRFLQALAISLIALLPSLAHADTLRVSAAISLQESATEIAKNYKNKTGDDIVFSFGSSGQLAAQISAGADADLFISAADKQVDDLIKSNDADPATRAIIARNTLVLIVPANEKDSPKSFADLAGTRHKRIAIGDPKTVPAGDYALQTLTALSLADKVKDRLVYATNVRQVLAYVEQGEVAAGIVYATDARQSSGKVNVVATAAEKDHQPINYPAIITKRSRHKDAAARFLDYLKSPEAQKVLTANGFTDPIISPANPATPATAPAK